MTLKIVFFQNLFLPLQCTSHPSCSQPCGLSSHCSMTVLGACTLKTACPPPSFLCWELAQLGLLPSFICLHQHSPAKLHMHICASGQWNCSLFDDCTSVHHLSPMTFCSFIACEDRSVKWHWILNELLKNQLADQALAMLNLWRLCCTCWSAPCDKPCTSKF